MSLGITQLLPKTSHGNFSICLATYTDFPILSSVHPLLNLECRAMDYDITVSNDGDTYCVRLSYMRNTGAL